MVSHLVAVSNKAGWLTSKCHTTAHRPSVCGVIRSSKQRRHDDAGVCHLGREAAVPTNDAEHLRTHAFGRTRSNVTRLTEMFFSQVPAADREDQKAVHLASASTSASWRSRYPSLHH